MNELALSGNGGALAVAGTTNFFEEYAEASTQKSITGTLLKFSKGDWLADNKEIPANTSFVANMDHLMIGWVRWSNSKPTDHVMGRISQGYKPPLRSTLGDMDESGWEVDLSTGKAKDPWQLTNYLVLQEPVGERRLYTFTTSSKGGISAVSDLCKAYGAGARMRPAEFPIVALRVSSYEHSDKAFGRIKVPVLTIVGWAPKSDFEAAPADEGDGGTVLSASQQLRPHEAPQQARSSRNGYAPADANAVKF